MSKCEKFIKFFDELVEKANVEMDEEVKEFYEILKTSDSMSTDKPAFTETGLQILGFLQTDSRKSLKSKDIADGLLISSRKVSGAMRKLCNDGYVEKFGQNPVNYMITEKGKNYNIND